LALPLLSEPLQAKSQEFDHSIRPRFSIVSAFNAGPLTLATGSMGAAGVGSSLAYLQSASFTLYGGSTPFLLDLTGSNSLGSGFDSALLQVLDNGNVVVSQSFANLAAAQAYFASKFLSIYLAAGFNNVQLAFSETMSRGEGFSFDFASASVSATPLPPAWTMMLIGLAGFGFVAYRRKSTSVLLRQHFAGA
jgi:hypothetical protein